MVPPDSERSTYQSGCRYVDRPLTGDSAKNRSSAVDFDRRRPIERSTFGGEGKGGEGGGGVRERRYRLRFSLSSGKAYTARYVPVWQLIGTRTGRYRAVPLKLAVDNRFRPSAVD
ncbi:hypothetical protein BHM03_00059600 [Ensete ventricosum]|nr:hypothetical protein BHM03_00059600 [Ensete ventricosum]